MVIALKELSIRGDFRTTVEYLIRLLEDEAFQRNKIDTGWLDNLIAEKVKVSIILFSTDGFVSSFRVAWTWLFRNNRKINNNLPWDTKTKKLKDYSTLFHFILGWITGNHTCCRVWCFAHCGRSYQQTFPSLQLGFRAVCTCLSLMRNLWKTSSFESVFVFLSGQVPKADTLQNQETIELIHEETKYNLAVWKN